MQIRFPAPLAPGDLIGVTSPSSGVPAIMAPRLEFALDDLRQRGYDVRVGECMDGHRLVSAPKAERAKELMAMLLDPAVKAVVPPWGGELAIDLLDLLDWDALAAAEPTWVVGYSDMTTIMVPLTLRAGWATLHGSNLMDSPYRPAPGLAHWTELATATGPVAQRGPGRYRTAEHGNYIDNPTTTAYDLDATGGWRVQGGGNLEVTGRLVGGCVEVLGPLAGTRYANVADFGCQHTDEGLIVYLEACDFGAADVGRILHGFRLAGWFDEANAILIGRSSAPASGDFTQHDAVADALGDLDVPVVLDVDCGHVAPFLPLVNGASARVTVHNGQGEVSQELR